MNPKAKELRLLSAQKCKPFSGMLAINCLLFAIITSLVGSFSAVPLGPQYIQTIKGKALPPIYPVSIAIALVVILVVLPAFTMSIAIITKKVNEGIEPTVADLFSGFSHFFEAFLLEIIRSVFLFLWSLLLIVPGIIKSFSYSMAFFVKMDNPDMGEGECLARSNMLMIGNKWRLFCLYLSYIGWELLCLITLGILTLWVYPKIQQAKYQFYLDLLDKEQKNY